MPKPIPMKLARSEEQLMGYLWKLEKAFMKDLIKEYPEPKPANTTIATLLKRMRDKGFIDYKVYGKSREYFPLVSKKDYLSGHFKGLIKTFFGGSKATFASFFTRATDLSNEELKELRAIIDEEIKNNQKDD